MLFARRVINAEAAAKCVKRSGRSGELCARDHQRIGGAGIGQAGEASGFEFVVKELHIESGVVDD